MYEHSNEPVVKMQVLNLVDDTVAELLYNTVNTVFPTNNSFFLTWYCSYDYEQSQNVIIIHYAKGTYTEGVKSKDYAKVIQEKVVEKVVVIDTLNRYRIQTVGTTLQESYAKSLPNYYIVGTYRLIGGKVVYVSGM